MKATLYSIEGKKKGEVNMPELFDTKIREDIVAKYVEIDKFIQPYSHSLKAGKKHSASGTISHKRHDWKGHYGKGIARLPRKVMWRRGTYFFWIGAEVSGTRGGRRSHGPKGIGKERKINKKERELAINSGFAATGNEKFIFNRHGRIDKSEIKAPIVVESKFDNTKTKDIIKMLKEIFDKTYDSGLILKKKKTRSGRGKLRGRKYKSNAGLLFVKAKDEKIKMKGLDIKDVKDIRVSDLFPLGRLAMYTEKALEELNKPGETK